MKKISEMNHDEMQKEIVRLQIVSGYLMELNLTDGAMWEIKLKLNRRLSQLVNILFENKISEHEN